MNYKTLEDVPIVKGMRAQVRILAEIKALPAQGRCSWISQMDDCQLKVYTVTSYEESADSGVIVHLAETPWNFRACWLYAVDDTAKGYGVTLIPKDDVAATVTDPEPQDEFLEAWLEAVAIDPTLAKDRARMARWISDIRFDGYCAGYGKGAEDERKRTGEKDHELFIIERLARLESRLRDIEQSQERRCCHLSGPHDPLMRFGPVPNALEPTLPHMPPETFTPDPFKPLLPSGSTGDPLPPNPITISVQGAPFEP